MKIALVHDALINKGGAERVALYLHQTFPEATFFTSCYDPEATYPEFKNMEVRTSFVQKITRKEKTAKLLFPLSFLAMKKFDFSGFDLVLSSSTWCAKNISVGRNTCYICLNYTPFRLAWEPESYFLVRIIILLKDS